MTKRKKHERPTGNDLWDKYFTVKMKYLHSRSMDQIQRYGVRVSGIPEIDAELDRQEIVTQMSIDMMFEKYRRGVTIRVVNYNDTAEIYRIIHSHLIAWAEYISNGINIGNAPLKDLIELDQFANVVYDKARSVFSQEERTSAIASNFLKVQSINFRNILAREYKETRPTQLSEGIEVVKSSDAEPAKIQERNSLKDVFANQINQLHGWRGTVDE